MFTTPCKSSVKSHLSSLIVGPGVPCVLPSNPSEGPSEGPNASRPLGRAHRDGMSPKPGELVLRPRRPGRPVCRSRRTGRRTGLAIRRNHATHVTGLAPATPSPRPLHQRFVLGRSTSAGRFSWCLGIDLIRRNAPDRSPSGTRTTAQVKWSELDQSTEKTGDIYSRTKGFTPWKTIPWILKTTGVGRGKPSSREPDSQGPR